MARVSSIHSATARRWRSPELHGIARYVLSIASVAAAAGIDLALDPLFSHFVPLVPFYLAIIVASWLGGSRAGLVALVLSAVAGNLLLRAEAVPSVVDRTGSLVVMSAVIVALVTTGHRATAVLRREAARRDLLARATAEFTRSLDYDQALRRLPEIAIPTVADACSVALVGGDGVIRRLALEHVDPAKRDLLEKLDRESPLASWEADVLRTNEPRMISVIPKARFEQGAADAPDRERVHDLGFRSYICVPLRRGDAAIGAITLATGQSGRHYDTGDFVIAVALADRVSSAIENSRLFGEFARASRAKDEFLAMLGHELRNPLAPILNALDLMALRSPDLHVRERTIIDRQVHHLVRLVDDLLDITRITRGKTKLHRKPVELADIVAKAVEMTSPLFKQRGHDLRVDVPCGLIVDGDADRLAQVVANLMTNAAKYTDPSGQISITGRSEDGEVALRVRDNGIGIAPEMLPRVFDVFAQESQALDRARGGLGLGLAIVRSLVELHGGSVAAASAGIGRGSEFTVRLPQQRITAPPAKPQPPPPRRARSQRVLVVDDNPDALSSLADGLAELGFEICRAADGSSALEVASRMHPDLALVDIGLPAMDGYELARRLHDLLGTRTDQARRGQWLRSAFRHRTLSGRRIRGTPGQASVARSDRGRDRTHECSAACSRSRLG